MKNYLCILYEFFIIFTQIKNEYNFLTEGYYEINSYFNNLHVSVMNKQLIISSKKSSFNIIPIKNFSYFIQFRKNKLGIDNNNKIIVYYNNENIEIKKYSWNIYNIKKNMYFIQNSYNNKLIEINHNSVKVSNSSIYNNEKKYIFIFAKLFEKDLFQDKYIRIINNEPIDVVIKYIDLGDKSLNRTGINQIYKDENCEELRYSIRSIFQYIPWIRKIYIIMPNNNIKFLKNDDINEKIIYIKDKDILGFDSANSPAFSFNLFKLEKYGISNNFIYMDDDYFIGQKLKKSDFFYIDQKSKVIIPYIISNRFFKINKNDLYNKYYKFIKKKNNIHPHSSEGFNLEILCTQKYFIEFINASLVSCKNTHNAFPENIKDLKEIFDLSKNYKFFNEMIYSKERFILSFYHQMFSNLYQLNVKYRKVHFMLYRYISIEKIKKNKLDSSLFVLNTGGNHQPIYRQKKMLKNIMEKRFPFPTIFEIKNNKEYKKRNLNIKYFILIFIIFLELKFLIYILFFYMFFSIFYFEH